MLNDTHLIVIKVHYVGDTEQQWCSFYSGFLETKEENAKSTIKMKYFLIKKQVFNLFQAVIFRSYRLAV